MSLFVTSLKVAGFYTSLFENLAKEEALPTLETFLRRAGYTETAIGTAFEEDPLKTAAEACVALAVVIALGPEITAAGAAVAAGLTLAETFGIATATANAIATAVIGLAAEEGTGAIYGKALNGLAKFATDVFGGNLSQLPTNEAVAAGTLFGTGLLLLPQNSTSPVYFGIPS